MKTTFFHWIKTNRTMLLNSGSLVSTTIVTSSFGFIYWWLAARLFSPEAVGLASAAISAMTLLATISLLGLGTLLINELPRQPGNERSLVSTAIFMVGGVGGFAGIVFAMLTSLVSKDLQALKTTLVDTTIFASGVSLTAITFVLDQALIGLLRGELQLWRNALFAATKLVAILVVGLYLVNKGGLTIYATWAIGNVVSLLALFGFVLIKKGDRSLRPYMPQWKFVPILKHAALQHHILNLTIMIPSLVLPVLVTILLSAKMNAWFYVSFTIANFVSFVLYALTTVLNATNATKPTKLSQQIRLTLGLSVTICILANCLLFFGARQILSIFGPAYAEQAAWSLRIMGLGAFPVIVKDHYIAVSRIHRKMALAVRPIALGCLLELGGPIVGEHLGSVSGLSLGWVLAMVIEAIYLWPTVYQAMCQPQNRNVVGMQAASDYQAQETR